MIELKKVIDNLVEFGTIPNVDSSNKLNSLRLLLADLHSQFLHVSFEYDDKDYTDPPDNNSDEIRSNVESNFPEFGFYHSVFESHIISKDADVVMGDAIDDLTDIIKDMLDVKWRLENTSTNDALWDFELSMRSHSEQHLVNLMKYLKDKLS
ncbi:MAG: DUF5063 domain-containing protein [Crocinitomicaceae bacterium]|nr:DUF5063 domain-containing protein [Crocinitomicaceae bacterium]